MIVTAPEVTCTAVKAPNEYTIGERKGVSYKVEISDGTGSIELPVIDGDVWKVFQPFGKYAIDIEVIQTAIETRNGARMGTRLRIVQALGL